MYTNLFFFSHNSRFPYNQTSLSRSHQLTLVVFFVFFFLSSSLFVFLFLSLSVSLCVPVHYVLSLSLSLLFTRSPHRKSSTYISQSRRRLRRWWRRDTGRNLHKCTYKAYSSLSSSRSSLISPSQQASLTHQNHGYFHLYSAAPFFTS